VFFFFFLCGAYITLSLQELMDAEHFSA